MSGIKFNLKSKPSSHKQIEFAEMDISQADENVPTRKHQNIRNFL